MITDKTAHEIQGMKSTLPLNFIREFDKEWEEAVKRVRSSGKRLWNMPIVPGRTEKKNVRT